MVGCSPRLQQYHQTHPEYIVLYRPRSLDVIFMSANTSLVRSEKVKSVILALWVAARRFTRWFGSIVFTHFCLDECKQI